MASRVQVSFGNWLLQRRRAAGISQDELAERIGCAPITLQKIVSGKRRPSRQIALLLAAYFGVPEDEHEAFVTFARASIPTPALAPGNSSLTASSFHTAKPGDLTEPAKEAGNSSSQAAPWRAVHLSKSNLPVVLTTLIGREQDLDEVSSRLMQPKVRLLTVTGSPGTGKTSLCIALATALLGDFEDGVYLVELALVSDRAMVIPSIARALGLGETVGQSIEETLLGHIKDKRILLLLDNFEHLLDAGPAVVKLVQASPWVKVLITSREALHVRGERQYPLSPLGLPVPADKPSLEELARNPAVQLFVERAQDVDVDFALTEENAWDVAKVCINMSGLPLAIELAAGRVSLFPPRILVSRLGQQLKVLTGGSRDLPPRQRTLRQAIDWSYNLLDEGHRELFRRAALFWGGFTLQSLEAVCNSASLQVEGKKQKVDVVDGVEALVSSNLVQQREDRDGEPRFWLLETIHEYAKEKLAESEDAQILQREHALYFMRFAESVEPHLTGIKQVEWMGKVEEEHDNFRAALRWAMKGGSNSANASNNERIEAGLRIGGALYRFWLMRGYRGEGADALEALLTRARGVVGCSSRVMAKALNLAGTLSYMQGDNSTARSNYQESLALNREIGDKNGMALSLGGLGIVAQMQGDNSTARPLLEEGLALRRELGDKGGIANSLGGLGIVAQMQGDNSAARSLYEESLTLNREIGDKNGIAGCLGNLGNLEYSMGEYGSALSHYKESLLAFQVMGDKHNIAWCLGGVGGTIAQIGQTRQAGEVEEEVERGARLLGAAEALLKEIDSVLEPVDRIPYDGGASSARSVLGEERFERLRHEGQAMSMEEAVDCALEGAGGDQ